MENLSLYIAIFCATIVFFTFVGFPFFEFKKIKIDYKDFDSQIIVNLRRKRPDIDMKFALFGGLENVKADIDDLYGHREFYDYIIGLLKIQFEVKTCLDLTVESFKYLSGLMKKPKRWWMSQYYKAGRSRKAALKKILDSHYANFNNFKTLVDELKKIRIDYETN